MSDKSFKRAAFCGLTLCVSLSCSAADISAPLEGSLDDTLIKAFNSYLAQNTSLRTDIKDSSIADGLIESALIDAGQLHVNFDRAGLELFVKSRNATVLGAIEDPVLVYMVDMSPTSQAILTDGAGGDLASAFLQSSDLNSIRIMFPLMDLDDIQKFSAQTILSHNDSALSQAAQRYGSDFYIAGAIESDGTNEQSSLKFNVCTKDGVNIHSGSLSGSAASVINALMHECRTAISSFKNSTADDKDKTHSALNENTKLSAADLDVNTLGPGQDFVRIALYNVNSLEDIKAIKDAFITYGYDDNVNVVRIEPDHFIVEIKTSAKPTILDSTMRRAGDFSYVGAWSYSYLKSVPHAVTHFNTMGKRQSVNAVFGSDVTVSAATDAKQDVPDSDKGQAAVAITNGDE
ncbi:Uncharacterized protein conserved in bacteria (DUF2066) [Anaerobiospirillum thomasii]|uniref:DUF2066 domain-containing protein n=1 Tax=Anaerobiospirillum thomasii TaxID=179995 RepID=UPI000D87A0A1|nr:DUF2066 domain-containing protein [Anaerobiospirillum thomasii]SPT68595.1 Uncharacterized protein conserved in bacteria (DUF2066) [Anaerobiospirillum thomasii]